ncbi:MAG: hypothetical protein ACRDVP_06175, partial [Acidimicrobiales bacterium]
TPDGPRVIEVNGRMGGGVLDMVEVSSGVNLLALQFRAALGERLDIQGELKADRIGFRIFCQPPSTATRLISVGGLQSVAKIPQVLEVAMHLEPGDRIDVTQGSRAFVFSVIGAASCHGEVLEVTRAMYEAADVCYEHSGISAEAARGEPMCCTS